MKHLLTVSIVVMVMSSGGCGATDDPVEAGPRAATTSDTMPTHGTTTSPPGGTTSTPTSGSPSTSHPPTDEPPSSSGGITDGVLIGASFSGRIDFGNVTPGAEGSRQLGVRNASTDGADVTVQSVGVSGEGFALSADECSGVILAFGDRCMVTVVFHPIEQRAYTGSLTVEVGLAMNYGVTLTGVGGSGLPSQPHQSVATPPTVAATG